MVRPGWSSAAGAPASSPSGRWPTPGRGPPAARRACGGARAQVWAGAGWTQRAIADRLGVARSVIGEVLARVGPAPVQDVLPEPAAAVESELTDLADAEELGTEESGTDAEVTVPV